MRLHEHFHGGLKLHGGKPVEKFIQLTAAFEVLEERDHRHPGAGEYRSAAEDVRVGDDTGGRRMEDVHAGGV